jgi:septal ring factor EnvC (AmiA/AmiB activator)
LKGYSIFVREKETELRELIQKLNNRNSDSTLKDEIIFGLKKQIANQFTQMSQMQLDLTDSKQKLKAAQVQIEDLEKEKDFLHSQIMESKRHNKLLKLAIQRL